MSPATVVLIMGANRGIGFGVARSLAKQHPNYIVITGSRKQTEGEKAASLLHAKGFTSVTSVEIDVTSDASITTARDYIKEQYQRLDVLINNAGIAVEVKNRGKYLLREMTKCTYDVNVFGAAR
ncbi:Carbonyl reductase [NADPH] 1 [Talaromyces pinophilus]|nr:Carbonyl reductase [NADPH] 1 [Talaromyces pinophilus]